MHVDVEAEVRAKDVLPENPRRVAFVDGGLQVSVGVTIFVANVEIRARAFNRIAGKHDAFEYLMRIFLHQDTIVIRTRFRLVGIDAHIDRAGVILRQKRPLQPCREPRTATPTQPRIFYLCDDFEWLFLLQNPFESGITTIRTVAFELPAIGLRNPCKQYRFECHVYLLY